MHFVLSTVRLDEYSSVSELEAEVLSMSEHYDILVGMLGSAHDAVELLEEGMEERRGHRGKLEEEDVWEDIDTDDDDDDDDDGVEEEDVVYDDDEEEQEEEDDDDGDDALT